MPFWQIATHGHALQLDVSETIKAIKIIRATLDAAFELNKLIKYSMAWKSYKKQSNTFLKGKELPKGWEKELHQETLVAEHCNQIVGLSQAHCCKLF